MENNLFSPSIAAAKHVNRRQAGGAELVKLENSQPFALLKLFLHSKKLYLPLNSFSRLLIAYIYRLTGRIGNF